MKKLWQKEAKKLSQNHTVGKQKSQSLEQSVLRTCTLNYHTAQPVMRHYHKHTSRRHVYTTGAQYLLAIY